MFATGSKFVPPTGFRNRPAMDFLHEAENDGRQSTFPKANTCACLLHLPITHTTYEAFVESMNTGILCAQGFGYA